MPAPVHTYAHMRTDTSYCTPTQAHCQTLHFRTRMRRHARAQLLSSLHTARAQRPTRASEP
eukprot:2190933-Pleurochrysis_carterae.AAC.3